MDKGKFSITYNSSTQTFSASSIKPQYESISASDSGRSDDGIMHITWLRSNVRKYEIEMPPCDWSEVNRLLAMVQGHQYTLTINDPLSNTDLTLTCYTSNSSCDIYSGVVMNGLVTGLTFNAIEV